MLTAAEVGKLLGISPRAVYDLASEGRLKCRREDGRVSFNAFDVEAFKESCYSGPKKRGLMRPAEARKLVNILRAAKMPTDWIAPEVMALAEQRYRNERRTKWANKQAIEAIYAEAKRLTQETGIPHHVDHIIPLQGDNVSGLHVETNLRIMTATENIRKRNKVEP